jgi:uncharacterized membrane protein YhiD involved in acid resistance
MTSPLVTPAVVQMFTAIGLAFLLSMLVAKVYMWLQRHSAPQHMFVQSLAVAGVVSALVVLAVGDNVARGIGLVGALTVIRFRSTLKDPRDLIFAFASLATGVAAGAHAYGAAIVGTVTFLGGTIVAAALFGPSTTFDAVLTLRTRGDVEGLESLTRVLQHYSRSHALVRVRQIGPDEQEHSYQVSLRDPETQALLLRDVERQAGASQAMLVAYEPVPGD